MSATNRRIRRLINDVKDGRLTMRPFFQRRLVWTTRDKEFFIETVLKNLPFPEIFVATGKAAESTNSEQEWLVDGQQRVSALCEYCSGSNELAYKTIPRFEVLDPEDRNRILNYEVAVRDLGIVTEQQVRDIFSRINSTDYSLNAMEKANALFSGQFKEFCESLTQASFFVKHDVFTDANRRRMADVTFCVILVTTLMSGYFRRNERNEDYLERYNDEFPEADRVQSEIDQVFDFIDACAFPSDSRAWQQTDLFTLIVEVHSALIVDHLSLQAQKVGAAVEAFYREVARLFSDKNLPDVVSGMPENREVFRYLKAATKATNDKYARIDRAEVISAIIRQTVE